MVFATRHIPATHVAMLLNLDVIFGPFLAVVALGEYPTMLTVVVCIILITVLAGHTAVYESGLDDRPASDWFRFPLCVRAVKVQHRDRDTGGRGKGEDSWSDCGAAAAVGRAAAAAARAAEGAVHTGTGGDRLCVVVQS